ncbi:heat-inducible transcription repressor HrcA [Propionibacterium sp. oral taxon 192 str. F0372]|uniref:heat-inducible transcriptional repressor HrcA n=1 Tax=Propionibacterium sp. oral taxon 192 TaxID=671222 RepID=UPI000352E9DF|nr:heat-inducible transcriptional repressor HrcA [Propionibacterium sp. oral taxon 192]EPH02957.1 heat-inducible transcription repressor HrcA [Propionibacterium sp. oral taxon 192 str. F0372]
MDNRKLEVLKAIVTDYVATREPVGSKALVERHGLDVSPATIRNDMAVLEEEGYLVQPHTSAGRIPTDKGYRLFVDRLTAIKPLSGAEKKAISTFLTDADDLDDIIHRTVRMLAQLTRQVAIVQYPVTRSATIRHIELVSLSVDRVMVIVIDSMGRVDQRQFILEAHDDEELTWWRDRLNAEIVGMTPELGLATLGTVDPNSMRDPLRGRHILEVVSAMLITDPSTEVVVAGVPNLIRYGAAYETAIRSVLEALEEQVVLLKLLGEAATDQPGDVSVRIGVENPYQPLHTTSLVASSYGPDERWASMGVVGPTHMDYPSTIAAVRAVARYVGKYLAEG